MYKTITLYDFHDAFNASGKHTAHGFSYDGLTALYEYITELEEDIGDPVEFDLVALRCEYSEYLSLQDAADAYAMSTDELWENTPVIETPDGGVIVTDF